MEFLGGVFIIIMMGIVADTIVKVVKARAAGKATPQLSAELKELRRQLAEQAATLDDTLSALASQSAQLEELHQRVDFAERLLSQARERPGLDTGAAPPE